tara:strand:- start:23369 stop:25258 length:1890 start_codon:yes stop_codon:yes gene_type:complete
MSKSNDIQWGPDQSRESYRIPVWGEGHFDVNSDGHMSVAIDTNADIDLYQVCQQLHADGCSFPILIRFPELLNKRVVQLAAAFDSAISRHAYSNQHHVVYPIKVNQQRTVVEHLLAIPEHTVGLEVGSKPELLAALALLPQSQRLLICNGYKDRAYIRLALHAQAMGIKVIIVLEKLAELDLILEESESLGLSPDLGVRIRLNSIASGQWQNSGGPNAKFGLETSDLLQLIEQLKAKQSLHWLRLLHFHMGSQISVLADYEQGLREAMQVYAELHSQGCSLDYLDIGGGMAIDYAAEADGSYFSRSYSYEQYANLVISCVAQYCQQYDLQPPQIITEHGRALVAHHAVLVTNVMAVEAITDVSQEKNICQQLWPEAIAEQAGYLCAMLMSEQGVKHEEINNFRDLMNAAFLEQKINLQQRAYAEQLIRCCKLQPGDNKDAMSVEVSKYFCNFSIFQSLPDVWGLGQIFPIVPLHRLEQEPKVAARLHDITCDSDGQIQSYVAADGVSEYLKLHALPKSEDYLLGFFLVGAYQEVLGDIHNLFGDTHTVNVSSDGAEGYLIDEYESGDCVQELLASVHIDARQLTSRCQQRLQKQQCHDSRIKEILHELEQALMSYSYLDSQGRVAHPIK